CFGLSGGLTVISRNALCLAGRVPANGWGRKPAKAHDLRRNIRETSWKLFAERTGLEAKCASRKSPKISVFARLRETLTHCSEAVSASLLVCRMLGALCVLQQEEALT